MKLYFLDKKFVLSMVFLAIALVICGFVNLWSATVTVEQRQIPIYNVQTDKKVVAITFDSAWDDSDLSEILKCLKKYECKATFFVVGDFLDKYTSQVEQMHKDGHEVANHSDTHPHPNTLSREKMIEEMDACDEKIRKITGKENILFRPPYGEYNNLLVQTCKDTNRFCIQWDCDVTATVGKLCAIRV